MAKYQLPNVGNCDVLIHLVREFDMSVGACLHVAMTNDEIKTAVKLLTQECPICFVVYVTERDEVSLNRYNLLIV